MGLSGTEGDFSGPLTVPPWIRAHPPLTQDADDAMSPSSWASLAKWKERDWWSVDLEGEMEKLDVEGGFSRAEGGSVDLKGKQVCSDKSCKRRK